MNSTDLNEIYRQSISLSTAFAACCEHQGNFDLANIALEGSHPIICQFLLEDAEDAADRAYVLQQLLVSLNGQANIKASWREYNKKHLRTFLIDRAGQMQRNIDPVHLQTLAQLWRFGQNVEHNKNTIEDISRSIGLNGSDFLKLNQILIHSTTFQYYRDFFAATMETWCTRARLLHQKTSENFSNTTNQPSVKTSKVVL